MRDKTNPIQTAFEKLKDAEERLKQMSKEQKDAAREASHAKLKPFTLIINNGADASFLMSAILMTVVNGNEDGFANARRALFLLVKVEGIERGVTKFLEMCGPQVAEFDSETETPLPPFIKPLFIHVFNCMYGEWFGGTDSTT